MYYRVAGYDPAANISFIVDSNGKFEKLWQFSAYIKSKGCDIVAVSKTETMIDENSPPIEPNSEQFAIRSCAMGMSTWSSMKINGTIYKSLRVGNIEYVPDIKDVIRY